MVTATTAASPPLVAIAADALDGLAPIVVVNRRLDTALTLVSGKPDAAFPTIHQDTRGGLLVSSRKLWRGINERIRGTHGDGADAGHTAYGSLRFVRQDDVRAGAAAVLEALRVQGNAGVRAFGPVSFVAEPRSIAGRATFAADDTGSSLAPARPPADLAQVVAERLERADGIRAPASVGLLHMSSGAARDAVRGWLLSDALADSSSFIEAQVRRLTPRDLLGAIVDLRPDVDVVQRPAIDPGRVPTVGDAERLEHALRGLGVPMSVTRP